MESNTVVLRGFSNTFGMDKKLDIVDLQFIEGEELERAWKTARRQRLKQQEEKIWSEFVKEEDVLQSVCKEDPYQFLDQIPQEQVDELVECELSRFKKELEAKNAGAAGDSPRFQKPALVTFNDIESEEMFEIYDDNDSEQVAEENLNESLESPCTVRERDDTSGDNTERKKDRKQYIARASGASIESSTRGPATKNSNENVTTVIENSIYCAKVKDLRNKIVKELQDMINSLENQNVASIDPNLLRKFCKRAAEFSARFQRIHLYQLQRQVNDLKRHNSLSTPYGKHTQFQSQMVRIVALHQNTLQSLQVFHKSFEQTACLRECSAQLRMICSTLRDSTAACLEVRVPNDLSAAQQLYNDNLLSVCDDLENGVTHYIARVDEYVGAAERMLAARGKRSKSKKNWSQKATKNTTSGPNQSLSMYSLDTLRLNSKPSGKPNKESIKTGKIRLDIPSRVSKRGKIEKDAPKSHRKTPR
ncbi:hypothetical protein O0L34_g5804 [Tuta absoluta]|nr:hypothetical protein O0L34_g5804 [Tuta absoluta]